ncbi:MAG: HAMP domain-containing protein [Trueperaceae bacterium]
MTLQGDIQRYGTLNFMTGELVGAQYGSIQGREAFDTIARLDTAKVSFARMPVNRQTFSQLPVLQQAVSVAQTTASAKQTQLAPAAFKQSRNRFGMFPKVLLTVLFASLLPLIALWLTNYYTIRQKVTDNITNEFSQTSGLIRSQVNDWIDTNVRALHQASNLFNMTEAVQTPNSYHPVLLAALNAIDWSYGFTVGDLTGQQIARSDGKSLDPSGDREYFQQIISGQEVGHQVIMSRAQGKPALCISIPHEENAVLAGVMWQCGFLTRITDFIAERKVNSATTLFVTDVAGRLIAHNSLELPTEDFLDYSQHPALNSASSQLINYTYGSEEKVAYSQKTDLGFTVVIERTRSVAFSELRRVEQQAIFLFIAALVLITIVSYVLARRFVKPIENLTAVADGISKGKLDTPINEVRRSDELGELAKAISRLKMSVQVAMGELSRK